MHNKWRVVTSKFQSNNKTLPHLSLNVLDKNEPSGVKALARTCKCSYFVVFLLGNTGYNTMKMPCTFSCSPFLTAPNVGMSRTMTSLWMERLNGMEPVFSLAKVIIAQRWVMKALESMEFSLEQKQKKQNAFIDTTLIFVTAPPGFWSWSLSSAIMK